MTINIKIQKKDLWLLSAIAVFFVGVAYVIAYNPSMTGGNPSVMGHSSDEIMVRNSSGTLVSLQTYIDQRKFGVWEIRLANTVYRAATDGFVCVNMTATDMAYVQGYTDSNNPPKTMRVRSHDTYVYSSPNTLYTGMMMPVRKGDYWRINMTGSGGTPVASVSWIPLG